MQIEWDSTIEIKRGVELLLLSEMTNKQLVHQRLTAMGSSMAEMQQVIEYSESRCLDTPAHAIAWFLPLVEEGRRLEEVTPDGTTRYSTRFETWPEACLQYSGREIAGDIHFEPRVQRTKPTSAVVDLKPWGTTIAEVLEGFGEPASQDGWGAEQTLSYELPSSSNRDVDEVRLFFAFDLLQQLGRRDRLDWRRYGCAAPSTN